jgi:hypothetical protein
MNTESNQVNEMTFTGSDKVLLRSILDSNTVHFFLEKVSDNCYNYKAYRNGDLIGEGFKFTWKEFSDTVMGAAYTLNVKVHTRDMVEVKWNEEIL